MRLFVVCCIAHMWTVWLDERCGKRWTMMNTQVCTIALARKTCLHGPTASRCSYSGLWHLKLRSDVGTFFVCWTASCLAPPRALARMV